MLQKQLDWLFECKQLLWAQKSRIRWLKLNDRYMRYFHPSTNIHRRRNHIYAIINHEGQWLMEEVDVRKCFVDHFKGMYQCKPNRTNVSRLLASLGCVDKSLSTQHFQFLTRPFIGTKLIAAMFQIGAWKALVLIKFLQQFTSSICWSDLSTQDIFAVLSLLNSGHLLKGI